MKKKDYQRLMRLYTLMPAGETSWINKEDAIPVKAQIIVVIGDMEAAYNGALMYHYIRKNYGYAPMIYCLGDKHEFLDSTKAELLRAVCLRLGVSKGKACMCYKGKSLQELLRNFYNAEGAALINENIIYATSFRYHVAVRHEVNHLEKGEKAFYFAPANPFGNDFRDEVAYDLRWGNFMNLWNKTLLVHEMIGLYGDYLLTEKEVDNNPLFIATMRHLKTSMACGKVTAVLRYCLFHFSAWWNAKKIQLARESQIAKYQRRLKELGFNY